MKMIEMRTCVDKDGRLTISEKTVEEAGFNSGDEVYVSLAPAKGILLCTPMMTMSLLQRMSCAYRVRCWRLRVSRRIVISISFILTAPSS